MGTKREWGRWFLIFNELLKHITPEVLLDTFQVPVEWRIFVIPDDAGGLALLALNPDGPKESAVYQSGLFHPNDWEALAHPAVKDYADERIKISLAMLAHDILELNK